LLSSFTLVGFLFSRDQISPSHIAEFGAGSY
jgi:hypothetical protein